jgi:hypothetical protein
VRRILKNRYIPLGAHIQVIKERIINLYSYSIATWGGCTSIRNLLQSQVNLAIRDACGIKSGGSVWAVLSDLTIPHIDTVYKAQLISLARKHIHTTTPLTAFLLNPHKSRSRAKFPHPLSIAASVFQDEIPQPDDPKWADTLIFKSWLRTWKKHHTLARLRKESSKTKPCKGLIKYLELLQHEHNGEPWLKKPRYLQATATIGDRTNTYPFMPQLKHQKTDLNLGNECLLCDTHSIETLKHILFVCPRYARLRAEFHIDINASINDILSDSSLSSIRDFKSLNSITIFRILQFRWKLLQPLFDTMTAEHSSQLLVQQQSCLPDTSIPD